jgi:quinol monooxygenase YgiN
MPEVVAQNFADPKLLDEILKFSRELVELTRREPGCVSYGVYQDTEHPEASNRYDAAMVHENRW